jgi:ssRNA-specific RNase YbeY (16S rRNA maturation enzyme)
MTVRVSVNYNDYRWKRFDLTSKVRLLMSKTVQIHQISLSDFSLSILACSDAKIRELNKKKKIKQRTF